MFLFTAFQVLKAEAVLVKIRGAIKNKEAESSIQSLISEFYSLLPHKNEMDTVEKDKRPHWLGRKQDMCQVILLFLYIISCTTYFREINMV